MSISIPEAPVEGTVRLQARPDARYQSGATPGLLGGAADPLIQAGTGLIKGGNEMAEAVAKIQERDDLDAVFKAEAATKEKFLAFQKQAQDTRRGDGAKGVVQDTDKWFKDTGEETLKGLANDRQRRAFSHSLSQLRITGLGQMADFEFKQGEIALDANYEVNRKATRGLAIATPTPENIATQLADLDQQNRVMLMRKGLLNEKTIAAANLADSTAIHTDVIKGLAVSAPMKAKEWYDRYKDQIDPEKRDDLLKVAQQASDRGLALAASAEAWDKLAPKKDGEPVKLADMENLIRERLKDNPDALEKSLADMRTRVSAFNAQRKAEADALESGVNKLILQGTNFNAIRNSPEFVALSAKDPEAARKVDTYMENKAYMSLVRANAAEERADRINARKNFDLMLKVSDPTKLAALSRDEVINMLPTLGRTATAHLLEKWDQFHKDPKKLAEAKIDNEDFKTMALNAGIRVNEKGMSEEEKDDLLRLKQRVEERIDQAINGPGGTKRDLTRKEKQELLQREIDNHVILKNSILPNWVAPKSKIAATLSPEERKKVVVPDGFANAAKASRLKQGLQTTPEQLIDLWISTPANVKAQYKK